MTEMVSKVPLQEKIAELESRIAALEKGVQVHSTITRTVGHSAPSSMFNEHWDKMWAEFNHVMKAAFRHD